MVDARRRLVQLDPRGMQLLEPWNGGDLCVIRAFVVGSEVEAMASGREPLLVRGFELGPLESGPRKNEEGRGLQEKKCQVGTGSIEGVVSCRAKMVPEADAEDRLQVSLQQEVWEVDFPYEVVKLEHLEGWTALHEAASYHCRAAMQDLGSFLPDDGVVSALAVECGRREAERQWYEESLAAVQPWYET